MKNKSLSLLLAAAMIITLLPVAALAAFSDTAGHWAEEAVAVWAEYGVLDGYGDGTFLPDKAVNRAEMAKILNTIVGYPDAGTNSFTDVSRDEWHYSHVLRLAKAEVIKGYGDGTFRPYRQVTREEAVVMIARAFGIEENSGNEKPFADAEAISPWADLLVNGMKAKGYIQGDSGGNFRPGDTMRRAEVVTILNNMFGFYAAREGFYTQDIKNNGLVNATGVTLRNMDIGGDLYILEGVANGDVALSNVTVGGNIFARGGGPNSITLKDCTITSMTITKDGARVVLQGSTEAISISNTDGDLVIGQGCTVDSVFVENGTTLTVERGGAVGAVAAAGGQVKLEPGAEAGTIVITGGRLDIDKGAQVAKVEVPKTVEKKPVISNNGTIDSIIIQSALDVTGDGDIKDATVGHDDVSFVTQPGRVTVGQGVEPPEIKAPVDDDDDDEPQYKTMTVNYVQAANSTTLKVSMAQLSGAAFSFGKTGEALAPAAAAYAGGQYTVTVPAMAAKTSYTLKITAPGYHAHTKTDVSTFAAAATIIGGIQCAAGYDDVGKVISYSLYSPGVIPHTANVLDSSFATSFATEIDGDRRPKTDAAHLDGRFTALGLNLGAALSALGVADETEITVEQRNPALKIYFDKNNPDITLSGGAYRKTSGPITVADLTAAGAFDLLVADSSASGAVQLAVKDSGGNTLLTVKIDRKFTLAGSITGDISFLTAADTANGVTATGTVATAQDIPAGSTVTVRVLLGGTCQAGKGGYYTAALTGPAGIALKSASATKILAADAVVPDGTYVEFTFAMPAANVTNLKVKLTYAQPKATISDVNIQGTAGLALAEGLETTITLENAAFGAIAKDADVSGWFADLAGLDAKVKAACAAGDKTLTVVFGGTPSGPATGALDITIPAAAVDLHEALPVAQNSGAKLAIEAAPSTEP